MKEERTIPPSEAFRLFRAAGAALVDVRTPAEFEEVSAAGAVSWPLDRIPARADGGAFAAAGIEPGRPILLLCRSGARACRAAERLASACADVRVVAGGTEAWIAEGLPVRRSGRPAVSLERQVRIAAGALVLAGTAAGLLRSAAWLGLPLLVGAGLVFSGITDRCGLGLLLARCPWNRGTRGTR